MDHTIDIVRDAPTEAPDYTGFCECGWASKPSKALEVVIYRHSLRHLEAALGLAGPCQAEGLGCRILMVDGDEVRDLTCPECGAHWHWGLTGWKKLLPIPAPIPLQ